MYMEIRSLIREQVKLLLNESDWSKEYELRMNRPPSMFDHLKWPLDSVQKKYLDRFVQIHPDTLKEGHYREAESITGIPVKNLKSIINTYGTHNESVDIPDNYVKKGSGVPKDSALHWGNKPITGKDLGIEPKYMDSLPKFKPVDEDGYYVISDFDGKPSELRNVKDWRPSAAKNSAKMKSANETARHNYIPSFRKNGKREAVSDKLVMHQKVDSPLMQIFALGLSEEFLENVFKKLDLILNEKKN